MERHTNLDYYVKSSDIDKLPLFAKLIFSDEDYSDEEKFKFKKAFLNKYLKNNKFRKDVQGCYLFFYENELLAVYRSQEDLDPNVEGYKTVCYEITDTPKKEYLLYFKNNIN